VPIVKNEESEEEFDISFKREVRDYFLLLGWKAIVRWRWEAYKNADKRKFFW